VSQHIRDRYRGFAAASIRRKKNHRKRVSGAVWPWKSPIRTSETTWEIEPERAQFEKVDGLTVLFSDAFCYKHWHAMAAFADRPTKKLLLFDVDDTLTRARLVSRASHWGSAVH
jgi:hypothetical protein